MAGDTAIQTTAAGEAAPWPWFTVLKVAHHGSASGTSAPFLAAVRPAAALVSAGAGNPFGHPAPAVLARLRAVAANVWRTDQDGEVTVRTDGRAVEITSFTGRRVWVQAAPPERADQPR